MQYSEIKVILAGLIAVMLNGCSFFVTQATEDFGNNLTKVILNHNEPETVAEAVPTYLLLLETLIEDEPDNEALLSSAATLYGAYIGLLNEESDRKKQLSNKALKFALRSACVHDEQLCLLNQHKYDAFETIIKQTDKDDIDVLYSLGVAWGGWIQMHKANWNAVAQLAQVKAIMTRVIEFDIEYEQGNAHVYLGVLATILPPALGGTPEIGKQHFETALRISEEKNLMVKVIYAKHYARMMFDRELHDKLLNSVMAAKLEYPGLTLMNTMAKKQAKDLLRSADEYF
jgi:hypothetical protein